jgi:UDP-2,3-diacylglucosamine pyrophosphatase LpxH
MIRTAVQAHLDSRFSDDAQPAKVGSIFISDVHLGCRFSQAESLLTFLNAHQPERLYLVGDVIDGWRLKKKWIWRPAFTQILLRLLALYDEGTRIYYTPGNHDEFLRAFLRDFGCVEICDEIVHEAIDGRRLLVLHGDRFDGVERRAAWLSKLGATGYDILCWLDYALNRARGAIGLSRVPLSASVKKKVKSAVTFVSDFEAEIIGYAQERSCHGVICGHIHTPAIRSFGHVDYYNTGDWVESRTALIEHLDGRFEMFDMASGSQVEPSASPRAAQVIDSLAIA